MALSREAIVLIFILGALLVLGFTATIHRMWTGAADLHTAWNQGRTLEQKTWMEALRARFQAEIWQIARGAREEMGLPAPYRRPRREWIFSLQASTPAPAHQTSHDIEAMNLLNAPGPIGRSWETHDLMSPHVYEESTDPDSDEDEYGIPVSRAQASIMARFSRRIGQIMPFQITTTTTQQPNTAQHEREMDDFGARQMNRSWSMDPTDEIVCQPNEGFTVARPPPVAYLRPLPRPRRL